MGIRNCCHGQWLHLKKVMILLYWKNLAMKRRHKFLTVFNILVPTCLYLSLLALFLVIGKDLAPASVNTTTPIPSNMITVYCGSFSKTNTSIVYLTSCRNTKGCRHKEVSGLVTSLIPRLQRAVKAMEGSCFFGGRNLSFRPIASEEELLREYTVSEQAASLPYTLLGGIVFDEDFDYINGDIPSLSYKIRFGQEHAFPETRFFFSQFQISGPGEAGEQYKDFVMIQTMLDFAYVEAISNVTLLPETDSGWSWMASQQQMPYPPYKTNEVVVLIGSLLPLFTVMSFCFIIPPILKRIVDEKQTGIKELMKLMGLPTSLHWLCWFLDAILSATLTIIIMVLIICVSWNSSYGSVIQNTNPLIVLNFFFLYTVSLILFLFAISTFFESPNIALSVSVILHLLSFFVPYILINDQSYASMATGYKIVLSLFPNINLWWGMKLITAEETKGVGVQWSNLFSKAEPGNAMVMGLVWIMFLVSSLIYWIVIWYIDNVKPGQHGVPKKWYFIFQSSYWKSTFWPEKSVGNIEDRTENKFKSDLFEKEPEGLEAGIVVRNLKKIFKSFLEKDVTAVDDISFSAFKTEITALLGHNGAGKTTTMSILSGMYPPTSGFAKVNGFSIETELSKVRQSLGLCPQHDMLFSDLTPYEHFMIFSMIKGLSWSEAAKEASRYITILDLESKKNVQSSKLSGGMKRKVHLGISLVADSKIVLLDEPTSGMDPEARRVVWDLLHNEKKNRCILLTTHFMEEADVLGDSIAIMVKGKIYCYGSPMFLKKKFGDGYSLTITKGPNCDRNVIQGLVKEKVAGSSLSSESKRELSFNLPLTQTKSFPGLFEALEQKRGSLDFLNLGLSATTLEDVFLRVGKLAEGNTEKIHTIEDIGGLDGTGKPKSKAKRGTLFLMQLKGLLGKRFIFAKRKYALHIIMGLVPVLMAIIAQVIVMSAASNKDVYPPLKMSLADYSDPIVYYQSDFSDTKIEDIFKAVLPIGKVVKTTDVMPQIMEIAKKDIDLYRSKIVIAAKFKQDTKFHGFVVNETVAVYNSVPNHALPISQNIMSNTLLKLLTNGSSEKRRTDVTNHPLPGNKFEAIQEGYVENVSLYSYFYGISFGTGVLLFSSIFINFPLVERLSGAKQVQLMTGLNATLFWFANILADGLLFTLSMSGSLLFLLTLDRRGTFVSNGAPGPLILLISLFGMSCIVMSYVLSFLPKSPTGGFTLTIFINIFFGAIAPIVVWTLGSVTKTKPSLIAISKTIRFISSFCPSFPFVRSIIAVAEVQERNNFCTFNFDKSTLTKMCSTIMELNSSYVEISPKLKAKGQCCMTDYVDPEFAVCGKSPHIKCHKKESFFSWDDLYGINMDLVFLLVDLLLLILLLYLLEKGILRRLWSKVKSKLFKKKISESHVDAGALDDDVKLEILRIESGFTDDALLVNKIVKDYGSLRAVNMLSFGVHQEECFGLLGINGAGKTTTFRILTGDEDLTSGSANLLNKSLIDEKKEFLKMVGYCPQFDSIIDVLTGREMLVLIARLRGIKDYNGEADRWLIALDIQKYADRACGNYSGGNKRKLSVGMAMVGSPPIIFLDEPTSGVDPTGRRQLWEVIKRIKREGQSVVLTSHSMEECEALCDRLGIMVNGQFQCLGSIHHLKSKFGQGFTILVKLDTRERSKEDSNEILEKVKNYTLERFPGRVIKDEHRDYLHFHVPDPKTPWSYLFLTMEGAKQLFTDEIVTDYSVSETSLEEVFISFAQHQRLASPGKTS